MNTPKTENVFDAYARGACGIVHIRHQMQEMERLLQTALDNQCNEVISRVEHIRGGMGPDTVIVTMITGQVLQIGLEGVNLYETRGSMEKCGEPVGGLCFKS
jgi:hypothetical protein